MRASIKRSLAARRHRAKIVVCKGGEDTRSAATRGAGASLRRDVVHDLTATRLYLFSSRGAAGNDSPGDAGNPGARHVTRGGSIMEPDPQVDHFPHDALVEVETIAAVESNLDASGAAEIDATGRRVMPEVIDIDASHRQLERYGVSTNYNSGTAAGSTTYNEYVFHRFAPEYRAHAYINELSGALGQINEYAAYRYL